MQTSRLNKKLIAFLCLAFLLRGLIPAGYMPDMEMLRLGYFKMTLCTAEGAKEVIFDRDMHPVDSKNTGDSHSNKSNPCLFGASPQVGVLNYIAALYQPVTDETADLSFQRHNLAEMDSNPAALPRAPPV